MALAVNDSNFEELVIKSDKPAMVDFWAEWCGPCRMVAPELEAIAASHGDALKVVKVNVDVAPGIAQRYAVAGIPTIALFRDGQPVAVSVGAKPRAALEAELGLVAAGTGEAS